MWYKTKEEAEEACEWKELQYRTPYHVIKDDEQAGVYWAQRKMFSDD